MREQVKLFMIEVEGRECRGYLYLLDWKRGVMHHLFGSVLKECFKYNACELLHERTIKWGIENGYTEYNFSGSTADFRGGTFRFKEESLEDK